MANSNVENPSKADIPSGEAKNLQSHSLPPEVLCLTTMHLTRPELYKILTINKQWFSIVIRRIWNAVHFIDFMKITEGGRQRAESSSRRRTWDSSWDEEEDGEDRLTNNKPVKPVKHHISPDDARRLAIYSPHIATLRLDDPEHYSASSYKVIREFSRMIDGWCETVCEMAGTDPSFWPNVEVPLTRSRITKSQISTSDLFPILTHISWRYETHWERMDFDVPLNPVHGLLQLPLTMHLHLYERIEYAARNSSRICFTNAVALSSCGEMATERLLPNLRGNSNLRDLELCLSRHSRIVHSGYWITSTRNDEGRRRHTSRDGSDEDSSDEDGSDDMGLNRAEEGWESNLERLILRSNYPQHLLLLLIHPSFLGQLQKLRYLHLHSTLKNKPPRPPRGSSSFSSGDESDEEDPALSLNWVTHPRYGTGYYGTNSLSRQRASMAPYLSLFQDVKWEIVRSPSDSTSEPPPPPPPPRPVVHVELPLFQIIAALFPRLEMLVLEGLWDVNSLTQLEHIPSALHPPHEAAANCSPVLLRVPVDFKRDIGANARTDSLILAVEQALKRREVVDPSEIGPAM